jgi:hypothetical protein
MRLLLSPVLFLFRLSGTSSHAFKLPVSRFSSSLAFNTKSHIPYRIRDVTLDDINKINACNLINLQEHYTFPFYQAQISQFPQLSLIAETENSETVSFVFYFFHCLFFFRLDTPWESSVTSMITQADHLVMLLASRLIPLFEEMELHNSY